MNDHDNCCYPEIHAQYHTEIMDKKIEQIINDSKEAKGLLQKMLLSQAQITSELHTVKATAQHGIRITKTLEDTLNKAILDITSLRVARQSKYETIARWVSYIGVLVTIAVLFFK